MDKYGMHVYTMAGRTKGSIVERFNRTIKERIGQFKKCKLEFYLQYFLSPNKKDTSLKTEHMIGIPYYKI